ncbi:hypothetical protein GR160_15090 [Flavobacterium sp. Sd200]|uniref:DUF5689 domain-containing protein n=1 Tax=Flavobacterium sp. Sd200 TaxID=2692211 RepID=UPI00136D47F6|nr:DUF5689 domain-containing protein [Flavobacterium sp. Sd200]MXN92553.1 hypothetical protein [Flavobacterium sp. Sd200]
MKNYIKTIAITALVSAAIAGCNNNDDYGIPNKVTTCTEPVVTVNKTVAEVIAATNSQVRQYPDNDDTMEAYVTSSDERGNFFKIVSLQTLPTDGSAPLGFSVAIDANTLFGHGFYPGKKVYIKLKDLYYATVEGSAIYGAAYRGSSGTEAITVGRIPESAFKKSILPSCSEISEEQLARPLTLTQAMTNRNINTLIDLQGVEFGDEFVGGTYFDANDEANTAGGATNRTLVDRTGASIVFRTSSFANFSGNKISGKSGVVRGILTKYAGVFQFVARYESDIRLTEDRFDNSPPITGANITYGLYNENFTSYAANNRIFPNAINDPAIGSRYWDVRIFNNNKYIQMTSFGGVAETNRTLFIVPVDMTLATTFSFKTASGYDNGSVLKVYYSLNYVPGGNITDATLVDITSNFNIPAGPPAAYASGFTPSGNYSIPAELTGNGYFIFEYRGKGGSGPTTTMQLDDIVVN